MAYSETTVALEFRFNDLGEITAVFVPGRCSEVNGIFERFPWAGRFRSYEERDGLRIPIGGVVE